MAKLTRREWMIRVVVIVIVLGFLASWLALLVS